MPDLTAWLILVAAFTAEAALLYWVSNVQNDWARVLMSVASLILGLGLSLPFLAASFLLLFWRLEVESVIVILTCLVGTAACIACFRKGRHHRRLRLATDSHKCRQCGYDLTGNVSGRCPECGKEIPIEPIAELEYLLNSARRPDPPSGE